MLAEREPDRLLRLAVARGWRVRVLVPIIRDRQGSPPVPVQAGDRFRLAETQSVPANGLKQKDPDGRDQEPTQARQCEWRGLMATACLALTNL